VWLCFQRAAGVVVFSACSWRGRVFTYFCVIMVFSECLCEVFCYLFVLAGRAEHSSSCGPEQGIGAKVKEAKVKYVYVCCILIDAHWIVFLYCTFMDCHSYPLYFTHTFR